MTSLKEQKEQFVTGLEGTTAAEVLLLCSTAATGAWLYLGCVSYCFNTQEHHRTRKHQSTPAAATSSNHDASSWNGFLVFLEVLAFPIPMILCQSVFLYPYGVSFLIFQVVAGFCLVGCGSQYKTARLEPRGTMKEPRPVIYESMNETILIRRITMTLYRSSLLLLTVIAILAVDFPVFPRRFGKTEVAGYSLMDLGAASFVVAAGFVSPRARQRRHDPQAVAIHNQNINWKRTLPVWILGLLRYATHQELDYQEHVSEYGVHWNFFWTLALLGPTATTLFRRPCPSWIPPAIFLAVYQWCFLSRGGQVWIETAPRYCPRAITAQPAGFICQFVFSNREGLLGLLSYASLFVASEWIAFAYIWTTEQPVNVRNQAFMKSMPPIQTAFYAAFPLLRLSVTLILLWQLLLVVLDVPVSRRSTNSSFVVWVLLVNVLQLVSIEFFVRLAYFSSLKQQKKSDSDVLTKWIIPPVLGAFNRHGLIVFVVANLLTGVVNLSLNTLQVPHGAAVSLLLVYTSTVGACGVLLDRVEFFVPLSSQGKRRRNDSQHQSINLRPSASGMNSVTASKRNEF